MKKRKLAVLAGIIATVVPAYPHHGTGVSYDASHPVTMKGVVTEFHYANPHPQLFFDVTDDKGNVVHWGGEFYPNPSQLIQGGWGKRRSEAALPVGMHITVTVSPSRAGTPVGAILKLLDDKGEVVMGVAGGLPGQAPSAGAGASQRTKTALSTPMRNFNRAALSLLLFSSSNVFAQGGRGILAADPKNANRPYDKHDISGIWSRNGSPGGYGGGGTCRDCGDRGYANGVPPLTPLGQKMFDANKPSYGRNLGSADAAAHPEEAIGRRRAVPPASGSDPYQTCNPMGPSRALIYPDPLEMNVLPDKILQQFEWGNGVRTIWTDGRELPKDPDLPRWWGYSVGKWDGDTFVVRTTGADDRTWIDQYGYPHTTEMLLEERYRRIAYDVLELNMSITDPAIYTGIWKSEVKKFRKLSKQGIQTVDGWAGLLEDVCAPADDVELFNKRIRDPAGGVVH